MTIRPDRTAPAALEPETPIERRLRRDAARATVTPSRRLRRGTLAALARAPHLAGGRRDRPRIVAPLAPAYAAAAALLLVVSTLAVMRHAGPETAPVVAAGPAVPSETDGPERARRGLVIAVDTRRLDRMTASDASVWKKPLFRQARSMVDDAFVAADVMLARLPFDGVRLERATGEADRAGPRLAVRIAR
jgi:hypothetical protein